MSDTERADLLEALAAHRGFILHTIQGLTDDQARQRTTVSELTLGGLVKHVAMTEQAWVTFILEGPATMAMTPESFAAHADGFVLRDDETLAGAIAQYDEVARRTDELVRTIDLDVSQPLPEAPWFPPARQEPLVACSFTSSPRRHNMRATPTSCARLWTARKRWDRRLVNSADRRVCRRGGAARFPMTLVERSVAPRTSSRRCRHTAARDRAIRLRRRA